MASNYERLSLVLGLILGMITGISSASTVIVGGRTGWTIPPSPSFYSSWASQQTIRVGDGLVFNFAAGAHTVAEVSKAAYNSCNTTNPLSPVMTTAPARITLKAAGAHYFICTIPGHCALGQKLAVVATAASSSSSVPSPAPQPSAVPSPTTATAPSTATSGGSAAALPPSGNFAAPTTAGVGLFGSVSVISVAFLFNLK